MAETPRDRKDEKDRKERIGTTEGPAPDAPDAPDSADGTADTAPPDTGTARGGGGAVSEGEGQAIAGGPDAVPDPAAPPADTAMPTRADAGADLAGDGRPPPPPDDGADRGRRSSPFGLIALLGVIALGLSVYLLWQRIDVMTAERDAGAAAVGAVEESTRASVDALADEVARLEAAVQEVRAADPGSEGIDSFSADVESRLGELGAGLDGIGSRLQELESRSEDIGSRLADIGSAVEAGRSRFENDLAELRSDLDAAVERLARPVAEPADVERLLLIANDALALQRDVGTALEALRTADARLHRLDDPVYGATRRQLGAEIAALEAVPRADIQGMAFALGGLQRELRGLSPRLEPHTARGAAPGDAAAGEERTWRTLLGDLWDSLRGLVVIRRTESQEGPLIAPEEQAFLAQNLYLELEAARLALLERDQENFRQSLETARDWLVTYYDVASPRISGMVERLDGLAAVELAPDVPDISGSLAELRTAMERRRAARQESTPPPPPAPAPEPQAEQAPAAAPDTGADSGGEGRGDGSSDEAGGGAAAGGGSGGEAAAAEATPDEATPDEATPDEATPDEATPDEATPDDATPDEAVPGEGEIGRTGTDEAGAGEAAGGAPEGESTGADAGDDGAGDAAADSGDAADASGGGDGDEAAP